MNEFKSLAVAFQLMDDLKAGVPRTAYQGVVTFRFNKRLVHIAPHPGWTGYNSQA
jgi:alpha-1,3-mannosyl-glycoprotein beta-1,2-N-acetylglucosaminyltransferase